MKRSMIDWGESRPRRPRYCVGDPCVNLCGPVSSVSQTQEVEQGIKRDIFRNILSEVKW